MPPLFASAVTTKVRMFWMPAVDQLRMKRRVHLTQLLMRIGL